MARLESVEPEESEVAGSGGGSRHVGVGSDGDRLVLAVGDIAAVAAAEPRLEVRHWVADRMRGRLGLKKRNLVEVGVVVVLEESCRMIDW